MEYNSERKGDLRIRDEILVSGAEIEHPYFEDNRNFICDRLSSWVDGSSPLRAIRMSFGTVFPHFWTFPTR